MPRHAGGRRVVLPRKKQKWTVQRWKKLILDDKIAKNPQKE
jgi:hypothetical protein